MQRDGDKCFQLYTMCYRQGVARPEKTSSLVRGGVSATHVDVPTVEEIGLKRKML